MKAHGAGQGTPGATLSRDVAISIFDLFTIGIGPSSSHTVGPMRAARRFAMALDREGHVALTSRVTVELFGSLGATGKGHGTDRAVLMGLEGEEPETIVPEDMAARMEAVRIGETVRLLGRHEIALRPSEHLVFHRLRSLPKHPNGMRFAAYDASGAELLERRYYSVGGGFVIGESTSSEAPPMRIRAEGVENPFTTGAELLAQCAGRRMSISAVMAENELAWRSEPEVQARLLRIWGAMQACVRAGCEHEGVLPGGLKVKRRAPALRRRLASGAGAGDPLLALDWVNLWALAVNEENAAGGRVVTAPTNGAAGIIPAVMHYYAHFETGGRNAGGPPPPTRPARWGLPPRPGSRASSSRRARWACSTR